ncbi:uncharacterized protein LOC126984618 [Eriocheir sinensis]|uniref:uncharacterized protein LOC126984618 n=1 Tax=Eriocheir sinensis TaxID=95602 RepID=UPI0021C9AFA0|nr:uncharacterized protein LOC126984618 [Eriocheir sinensis]XP_050694368.1 uncharacterized protein LOC126984618 [Eriocheir sinensis]XP_050694374.1 uncharacterized protein LOC126984618 [Eriocheir sinensis]XP_050694385.1 uncharacterized protein LOC126984618 [Eriocheir sinensis]XP_050694396.1 uncharacterized protein LOC126984618 [Eriocheir sinensis]XP_050694408.1 uncharacterized protein LOC126984618 [Eriocheir sinensis]
MKYMISICRHVSVMLHWAEENQQNQPKVQFPGSSSNETGVQYVVDLKTGICECKIGQTGQACKHQIACSEAYLLQLPQIFSNTPENRQWLAGIVLGKENVPPLDFFADFKECPNKQENSSGPSCNHNEKTAVTTSTSHKTEKQEHSRSNSPAIPDEHSSNYVREGLELMQSTSTESVPQNDNSELVGNNVKPSRAGVEGINEMNSTLLELFSKYEDDVLAGLHKFIKKLKAVRTTSQLTSIFFKAVRTTSQLTSIFFNAASSGVGKTGAGRGKIPCQPTSVARRITGMPRGAAPFGKGRKREGLVL